MRVYRGVVSAVSQSLHVHDIVVLLYVVRVVLFSSFMHKQHYEVSVME